MSSNEHKTLSAFELYGLGPAETPPPAGHDLHAGDPCPACGEGTLDYDGTLTLRCPNCGYGAGGCFT